MGKNKRDNYISTVKAIGIILMVIGHTIEPNFVCRFIYMFHMPLFFFCSGYFFKIPETITGVGHFFIRKVKGLYFPYIKWSLSFLVLHNLFYYLHFYPIDNEYYGCYNNASYFSHLRSIFFTMTGHEKLLDPFWFLKELLFASLFVCFMTYIFKKVYFNCSCWLPLFLLIALTVITKPRELGLPIVWNLSIMFLGGTFFYLGYLYRKFEAVKYYSFALVIICFGTVAGVVLIWNGPLDMLWYNAKSVLLYIPTAFVGIMLVMTCSYLIERLNRIKLLFYYIGKNTLIILALHLLFFKMVSFIKISIFGFPINRIADTYIVENNQFFWLIYVVCGLGGPLLCHEVFIILRRKLNNKYPRSLVQ